MPDTRDGAQRTIVQFAEFAPHFRLRWNDGYALVRLGSRGTPLHLPCPVEILGGHEVARHRDTILIGEHGSGIEDLLFWWFARACEAGHAALLLDADRPSLPAKEWFPAAIAAEQQARVKQRLAQFFEAAGNGVAGAPEYLDAVGGELPSSYPLHVLICRFTRVRGSAMAVAESLRSYREQQRSSRGVDDVPLRIVVGSASESSFMDVADSSGYMSLCDVYRLPALDQDDIAAIARHSPRPLALESERVEQILDGTGGQPRLVEDVLQRLHVQQERGVLPGVALSDVLRELRRQPPGYTGDWTRDLAQLLRGKSGLAKTLSGYAGGGRVKLGREQLNDDDRALYISGWLGLDRDGTWGMRSSIHKHLSLQVLDRVR